MAVRTPVKKTVSAALRMIVSAHVNTRGAR